MNRDLRLDIAKLGSHVTQTYASHSSSQSRVTQLKGSNDLSGLQVLNSCNSMMYAFACSDIPTMALPALEIPRDIVALLQTTITCLADFGCPAQPLCPHSCPAALDS